MTEGSDPTRTVARHGRQGGSGTARGAIAFAGVALGVVLVAALAVGGIVVAQLESNLHIESIPQDTLSPPPNISGYEGGFNILLVGDDTRSGQGGIGAGAGDGGALNDVTMLMHVAQDQKSAVVVSFPRDLIVPLPACSNGAAAAGLRINTALSHGGLSCVASTVQDLTGLPIQFAGLIKFTGVIQMSDAVGGVDVCFAGPVDDAESGLHVRKAGTVTLKGWNALAFLRARHSVGDGSDLGRISSQQVFLSSLVRKIKSDGTLTDLGKLYGLAAAATKNITLSQNFARPDTLVSIALVLKSIPLERVTFVQYPGVTGVGGIYLGAVAPIRAQADQLFGYLKKDQPFALDGQALTSNYSGSAKDPHARATSASPSATPGADPATLPVLPGVKGQTAAEYTCTVPYRY